MFIIWFNLLLNSFAVSSFDAEFNNYFSVFTLNNLFIVFIKVFVSLVEFLFY